MHRAGLRLGKERTCGVRTPVGARTFAPVHTDHAVHPLSCVMGRGSLLGVKRPERGIDKLQFSAEAKERVEHSHYHHGKLEGKMYLLLACRVAKLVGSPHQLPLSHSSQLGL